ncbi:M20/M25/M40 family metallo-hydrolase [soil metagenome]
MEIALKSLLTLPAFALIAAAPAPDPAALRASVGKLVSFGTRHTLSSPTDPKRGIGAARAWVASEFVAIGRKCGGCIAVDQPHARFEGARAPQGVDIVDVIGIQKGTGDPSHVVIVAGHIDSRVTDVMNVTSDAPGANDDASGVALVIEAARILSREKHEATIVYAALSGEEQGLFGGQLLASTAKARDWNVAAMLNNDIVGNTVGIDGRVVADRVRIFSEGIPAAADPTALKLNRASGAEDDSPSRALAKAVGRIATTTPSIGLEAMIVRRPDRFGRGGDHSPFLDAGFPAIRFSVGVENYDAQHQDLRTENGKTYGDTIDRMDFPYLAKVTALNVATLRQIADAPPAPQAVSAAGALRTDTTLTWATVPGAAGYRVRWRRADKSEWEMAKDFPATATTAVLKGIIVDDTFAGVSSLSAGGAESIVTFAGLPPKR